MDRCSQSFFTYCPGRCQQTLIARGVHQRLDGEATNLVLHGRNDRVSSFQNPERRCLDRQVAGQETNWNNFAWLGALLHIVF